MSALKCSCEAIARGRCGLISNDEAIARLIFSPVHVRKSDQSIKPGAFPLSHIREKGLSLVRTSKIAVAELDAFAKALAANMQDGKWHGLFEFSADIPRSIIDHEGNRSICLFEDPTDSNGAIPENAAHTLLISFSHPMAEEDAKEIRAALVNNGIFKSVPSELS